MQLYNALYLDGSGNVTLRTSGSGGGGSSGPSIADSLVIDAVGVYWYSIITEPVDGGSPTISYIQLSTGSTGTPTAPVTPAATNKTAQTVQTEYDATAAGPGYSIGDALLSVIVIESVTATILVSCWINSSTQLVIATPNPSNITKADQNVKVTGTVAVSTLPALPAGSNAIGSVSVSSLPALPTGSNSIGNVGVTSLPTLPAGTNNIGEVNINDGTGQTLNSLITGIGSGQNALLVAQSSTNFISSTVNSSTAQLAPNATFTGTIESVFIQQAVSILLTSDQPVTLTLYQYIDAAGIYAVTPVVFNILAGANFNRSFTLNGNYFKATVKNTGSSTTTTLNLNISYGVLPATTQLGNNPSSINEINGSILSLGNTTPANSIPVTTPDSNILFNNSISSIGPITAIDTTGFSSVAIQVSGTGELLGTVEGSNDGISWGMLWFLPLDSLSLKDTINASGNYNVKVSTRYVRLNVQNIISTVSVYIVGRNDTGLSAADYLSLALDASNNTSLNVSLQSGLKTDNNTGLIISDAPAPINIYLVNGANYIIDTSGYQSLNITTQSLTASITASDDGVNWQALTGVPRILGALTTSLIANAGFSFPCISRYIRITATATGGAIAYLRAQPWNGTYTTSVPTSTASNNVAQIGGTATVTGGVAGTLAVGGNITVGSAQTTNPLVIGAVDQGSLTRRLTSDLVGRLRIAAVPGITSAGLPLTTDLPALLGSIQNTSAINVQDTSVHEGTSVIQLLYQILIEMKIANQYLYDLPRLFNTGQQYQTDEPDAFRIDPTFFNQ